jgi:hypothetical protein
VTTISSVNLSQAPLTFISSLLAEADAAEHLAASYDPSSVTPPVGSANALPQITEAAAFQENGLTYFRLNYTDPDNDVVGFGFYGINGAGWAPEQHLFTSPSYGRVSPGQVEYPFNLLGGTPQAYQSDVAAYVFDAAGHRSPEVAIHLA